MTLLIDRCLLKSVKGTYTSESRSMRMERAMELKDDNGNALLYDCKHCDGVYDDFLAVF